MFVRGVVRLLCKINKHENQKRNAGTLAFIGIGNMGSRMANNLVKKGETVRVFDLTPANAKSVPGAQVCNNQEEAVKDASVIITMLPNGDIVKDTVLGTNGILKHASKGSLLIDCSTIQPQVAQEVSKATYSAGFKFLDAPVSGGVTGAEAGTLTFMVGGDKQVLNSADPILMKMGANVLHCGDSGAGQIAKLCNNLILAITMIGTCEGMNLGIKMGLDPKTLASIINVSTGRSWSSQTYNPVPGLIEKIPPSNDYKGGFAVNLVAKDLGLAEGVALLCNAPVPLTAAAHQIYRALSCNGYGNKDFASVYQFLKGN
ncbi:3-hydroxyisobutyrate dehydrogenase, mitochondrial [Tribolium castaneum]|uniref:3-hydroxyisobutyrate dehydrogenase n=1 Tax=Tribolium castaneum TaxID=7070 RepID=D6WRW0_TRICA|nr:PREDICTED: 3-hydroxyisobutyrate dehydrogenase, mitochondrial [Tribolium castaneum]EFA06587.2 putative 3-hydroxyisobutyrate dehydrogenase, mitochondrial-like Protein [Tribolium castaneum]|eukprot:XP_008195224.1 PREDICTED: 3-hydroxyisobutyrate dehydrogenase, mitochondrial [Tribolium castaneum]